MPCIERPERRAAYRQGHHDAKYAAMEIAKESDKRVEELEIGEEAERVDW